MAIVKNSFSDSRMGGDFSQATVSSPEDEVSSTSLVCSADVGSDDAVSDVDSGMGFDEIDLSEFGEPGMEFCQVGNQSCSIPLELYDLTDLRGILSLETWNNCLTEQERFALVEYLPDMEQEGFALNLKELFYGRNFFFGNPLTNFFNMLRAGLCDARVVLYRQGLSLLRQHHYYHMLRKYQNSMVGSLLRMRGTWMNCDGYDIEQKVRVLNILRRQRGLCYDKNGDSVSRTDSGSGDSTEAYWSKGINMGCQSRKSSQKVPLDVFSHGNRIDMELVRIGKEKAKGILKVTVPQFCKKNKANFPLSFDPGTEKKAEIAKRKDWCSGFDLPNGGGGGGDDNCFKEQCNKLGGRGDWDAGSRTTMARTGLSKLKDKMDWSKRCGLDEHNDFGEEVREKFECPDYLGRGRSSTREVTIASYDYDPVNNGKKPKCSAKNLKYHAKDGAQHRLLKTSQGSAATQPLNHHKFDDESVTLNRSNVWNVRGNGEPFFHKDNRTKVSHDKTKAKSSHEVVSKEYSRGSPIYANGEETESDSSDQVEEDGDKYPYTSRSEYPSTVTVKSASKTLKSGKKDNTHPVGGDMTPYAKKVKQKVKTNYCGDLQEGESARKSQGIHLTEKLQPASPGSYTAEKKRKCSAALHHPSQANERCNIGSGILDEAEDEFYANTSLANVHRQVDRPENKDQKSSDFLSESDHYQSSDLPIIKNIGKGEDGHLEDLEEPSSKPFSSKRQTENFSTMKKKGKRKADAVAISSHLLTPDPMVLEKGASEMELDTKIQKKSFTLITPTIHTGFSFSIIHLLAAVRKALVSPHIEDNPEINSHLKKDVLSAEHGESKSSMQFANDMLLSHSQDHVEGDIHVPVGLTPLPSLTIQEIVNCVKLNPGDPCILETQEPLQDLVRGALRILSSRTAPLGAKGWKALISYEKSSKSWSWVGPLSTSSTDNDNPEETSAETWSIPHKMLVKLVDAFANWLKSGQETLQQIGSLPAPPAMLPVMDEKERFRDLRAQKSLNTIRPSSEEVRAYFRKEELLRYSIPDRAFQYTAVDGRKSIVAPLRRGGGKPTSKARDHFMLKPDRPPHVTVLCLVRDSAARLPGSVGTRADVCTLIRDSQFIVEDVTDAQINQVVSGALDRLHYERDPCVQFDGDRKLWVYLHRDREDEDFEDDGTSSTKKWKRQRKDATDNSDLAPIHDSNLIASEDPVAVGSSGYDLHPDLNVDSSAMDIGDNGELVYSDLRPTEENFQSYMNTAHSERRQENQISWGVPGFTHLQENKMLCRENSTNNVFDDQHFSRDRTAGFLSGSLL